MTRIISWCRQKFGMCLGTTNTNGLRESIGHIEWREWDSVMEQMERGAAGGGYLTNVSRESTLVGGQLDEMQRLQFSLKFLDETPIEDINKILENKSQDLTVDQLNNPSMVSNTKLFDLDPKSNSFGYRESEGNIDESDLDEDEE